MEWIIIGEKVVREADAGTIVVEKKHYDEAISHIIYLLGMSMNGSQIRIPEHQGVCVGAADFLQRMSEIDLDALKKPERPDAKVIDLFRV
jgi:hypothetical protein